MMTKPRSWSYSRLLDFEQCPKRFAMKHIERIPEEQSKAASRGEVVHKEAEDFVRGKLKTLPASLRKFEREFAALRREFIDKHVTLEEEWGFDDEWIPTEYKTAWLRMKLDACVVKGKRVVVIDFKSGRKFGNELKHGEQGMLYALAACIRYVEADLFDIEFWYLDVDEITARTFTREQVLSFMKNFDKRAMRIMVATVFPATPNILVCKYCAYGPNKGGQCQSGIVNAVSLSDYRKKFG